jgi:hypothetical protein
MAASSRPTVERSFKVGDSARLGTIDKLHQIEHQSRGGGHVERTGLKIRPRRLHQNAGTRNGLIRSFLAVCPSECGCTTMQQNEADPALDPAPDFAKARPVPACRDVVAIAGRPILVKDKPTHRLRPEQRWWSI